MPGCCAGQISVDVELQGVGPNVIDGDIDVVPAKRRYIESFLNDGVTTLCRRAWITLWISSQCAWINCGFSRLPNNGAREPYPIICVG